MSAPAAMALGTSPVCLIPPSAIKGIPYFLLALKVCAIAVICGTPTPAIILVVQIDPGPIPTFIASTLQSIRSIAAS